MHFRYYLLTIAILFGVAVADPSSAFEAECSPPSASIASSEPFLSPGNFSFRTDNLTKTECLSYVATQDNTTVCSPVLSRARCDKDPRGMFAISLTYVKVQCYRDGTRTALARVTHNIHHISPDRAVVLNLNERADAEDPIHSDVMEPVRQQIVEVGVMRCVTPDITAKFHAAGTLDNLIALQLERCRNLVIEKQHFAGMRNIRMIRFSSSTIAKMEAYTFTDLLRLDSLMVEDGLGHEMRKLQPDADSSEEIRPAFLTLADFVAVRRLHCDCSFAWFRNFLRRKPHLTAVKGKGAVAAIGSYMTSLVVSEPEWPNVLSVDCSRDLTFDNIRAGMQFSYNTSCYTSAHC